MLTPTAPVPAGPHDAAAGGGARVLCSGDPYDLTGTAHSWSEFGEDDLGTLYRCDVCGVTDVAP
ncbi:hypothetical protein AB0K18_04035 [Nonomuraea sp. NPDC049421]|uniref:Uncharacterized protein n=1 Tax=Nonomuraea salmonea TaxID=46181 RepID=A0ABV5P3H3_9ACTN